MFHLRDMRMSAKHVLGATDCPVKLPVGNDSSILRETRRKIRGCNWYRRPLWVTSIYVAIAYWLVVAQMKALLTRRPGSRSLRIWKKNLELCPAGLSFYDWTLQNVVCKYPPWNSQPQFGHVHKEYCINRGSIQLCIDFSCLVNTPSQTCTNRNNSRFLIENHDGEYWSWCPC